MVGRVGVMNRGVSTKPCGLESINMGFSGYEENVFRGQEALMKYILGFNSPYMLGKREGNKLVKESYKQIKKLNNMVLKEYGKEKLLKFGEFEDYCLLPVLNTYERYIIIDNSHDLDLIGHPCLLNGEYYIVAIEGINSTGKVKRWCDHALGNKRKITERNIFYTPDYGRYSSTKPMGYAVDYSSGVDVIVLVIAKSFWQYIEWVKVGLKLGCLGLLPDVSGIKLFRRDAYALDTLFGM